MNSPLKIRFTVLYFLFFITTVAIANLDHHSHSYFHKDFVLNTHSLNRNSSFTSGKSSTHKTSFSKSDMEANEINAHLLGPIDKDLDLDHLTKFTATDFLDKLFGRRIFNVTMNVIVPIFHVVFPMHASQGSTLHLAMQALLGLFSFITFAITIIVPSLFTHIVPFGIRRSMDGSNSLSSSSYINYQRNYNYEKFKKLSENVGLDWNTCLQKTVCEAHRYPKQYGIVAIPFQIFFPPKLIKNTEDSWTVRDAATFGKQQDGADCGEKFKCFFDILDLTQYLMDVSIAYECSRDIIS